MPWTRAFRFSEAGSAGLDAHSAAALLVFKHLLGEGDAELIVVRADVGRTKACILGKHVGVVGNDRDALFLRHLHDARHGLRVAGRDAKAGNAAGHHVLRELNLLGLVVFGRANIGAGHVAEFLGGGLAALFDRRAECVVQYFENERELAFCSACLRHCHADGQAGQR